jgi:hypothetical protein
MKSGALVVAPTGVDPVTSLFSVVRGMILMNGFQSQALMSLKFLTLLDYYCWVCSMGFVGKMWAKTIQFQNINC